MDEPTNDNKSINMEGSSEIYLEWRHLSYSYRQSSTCKFRRNSKLSSTKETVIVKPQSGETKSGELVAIIGPSGGGKTTLLECLTGRRQKGLSGSVYVTSCKHDTSLSLSMLAQDDFLLGRLTVRETLTFAARFKLRNSENVAELVESVLNQLNMKSCASQLAYKCSGGERKRISIGIELIGQPKILVLDEPTSGLDSASAINCVQFLERLASESRLAIIASVHQPSASLLSIFHKVMVLSTNGQMLYFNEVKKLHPHLASLGYSCPPLHNIADYAIELASGVHGLDAINKLSEHEASSTESTSMSFVTDETADKDIGDETTPVFESQRNVVKVKKIIERMHRETRSEFFHHLWLLTHRTLIITLREPWLNFLRFFAHILLAIVISFLYSGDVGEADGCIDTLEAKVTVGMGKDFNALVHQMQLEEGRVVDNLSFHFFSLMFLLFTSMMVTIMVFPLEVAVFVKEHQNGCYSVISYYFAKTLADAPFTLFNSSLYATITYFWTGQIQTADRFILTLIVYVLISFVGQSLGMLVGALWAHKPDEAVFVAPVSQLPFLLLSGYFIKIASMPLIIQFATYFSYWRYAFELVVQLTYGLDRCKQLIKDNNILNECEVFASLGEIIHGANIDVSSIMLFLSLKVFDKPEYGSRLGELEDSLERLNVQYGNRTDSVTDIANVNFYQDSFVMHLFNLTDENLTFNMIVLLMFVIVFRCGAYIALRCKTTVRK